MRRRQVRGFSSQDDPELFFANLTGIAPGSNRRGTPRSDGDAEQFFTDLAGAPAMSVVASPAVAPGLPRRAAPLPPPPPAKFDQLPAAPPATVIPAGDEAMFNAPAEEATQEAEPLLESAEPVTLGGPEGDPPLDMAYPSDEIGEAVDITPIEADEKPLSFDKLLAIDTSQMVESWDDRSSAT